MMIKDPERLISDLVNIDDKDAISESTVPIISDKILKKKSLMYSINL